MATDCYFFTTTYLPYHVHHLVNTTTSLLQTPAESCFLNSDQLGQWKKKTVFDRLLVFHIFFLLFFFFDGEQMPLACDKLFKSH